MPWYVPEPDSVDAVLVGSANALRHGGNGLARLAGKPAYAVGETTASACREAGLEVAANGDGGLQHVLTRLDPAHWYLLRLAGAARVDLNPPPGVTIAERIVYASERLPMPPDLAETLREPAVIALHSAEAARHLRAQCETQHIDLSQLSLTAIGPRVAEAAGQGWREVRSVATPSEAALLALAGEMCKEYGAPGADSPMHERPWRNRSSTRLHYHPSPRPRPGARRAGPCCSACWLSGLAWLAPSWVASRGYLEDLGLVERNPAPIAVRSTVPSGPNAAAHNQRGSGRT